MFEKLASSFRDPSGFVFKYNSEFYRSIGEKAKTDFELFSTSGLYSELIETKKILPHVEVSDVQVRNSYKVIKPEQLQWISYPYEWSFNQLKDAALLTLDIQEKALKKGMTLKDASAYNVQFYKGKPVFIDTLSFTKYEENKPWVAYKQFVQHFLAPLALMVHSDLRLNQMLRVYLDGIPLEMASSLLSMKTKFSPTLMMHIHLHAKFQRKYSESGISANKTAKLPLTNLLGIINQLKSYIEKLQLPQTDTEWGDYYNFTNYNDESFQSKKTIIEKYKDMISPKNVWDLGANRGIFSRIFSDEKIPTIAWDIDPVAVDRNYLQSKKIAEDSILPLVVDLTNPSNALGWANNERMSMEERGPVDVVMALALVHHISISNNVPFDRFFEYLAKLGNHLIIEFVPKEDSQVKILLSSREDIFSSYDQTHFEESFTKYFELISKDPIPGSVRTLYFLRKI